MTKYTKKWQSTDNQIMMALIKLAKGDGINAVTVSDIINEAHINRSTFYRHYLDKYDLMEKMEAHIINDIDVINHHLKQSSLQVAARRTNQFIYQFLTIIERHQPALEVLLSRNGDIQFSIRLLDFFKNVVDSTAEFFSDNVDDKFQQIMSSSCAATFLGITTFWVHHFHEYDKEYVYHFLINDPRL